MERRKLECNGQNTTNDSFFENLRTISIQKPPATKIQTVKEYLSDKLLDAKLGF